MQLVSRRKSEGRRPRTFRGRVPRILQMILPDFLLPSFKEEALGALHLRASNEGLLRPRVARARRAPGASYFPLLRLTPPKPLCYSLAHVKTHSPRVASA